MLRAPILSGWWDKIISEPLRWQEFSLDVKESFLRKGFPRIKTTLINDDRTHAQRKFYFKFFLNQTEIRLYLPFSDWVGTKQNMIVFIIKKIYLNRVRSTLTIDDQTYWPIINTRVCCSKEGKKVKKNRGVGSNKIKSIGFESEIGRKKSRWKLRSASRKGWC